MKQDRDEFGTSEMFMEAVMLSYYFYYILLCRSRKEAFQQFLDPRLMCEQKLPQHVCAATAVYMVT